MTTFIGHAATGAAIYLCKNRLDEPQVRWTLPLFIFLAIAPDLDYLLLWFFKLSFKPRFSHSLVFCFSIGSLAWLLIFKRHVFKTPPVIMYLLASNSHLLLDLLVGVHSLPIFWPFLPNEIMLPIGILPSVIHIVNFPNYYFWRNFLIEMGILLPSLTALVLVSRAIPIRLMQVKTLIMGSVWLACLFFSLTLQR